MIPNVNNSKNNGYAIAFTIARRIRWVPVTTRLTFSSATTKSDKFPDVTNSVSSGGTQPRVASEKLIPRSRFFCHSRITIANGSFGFLPPWDSMASIRPSASINVKSLRNSDASLRAVAILFSVFIRKTIRAYHRSILDVISIHPRSVQQPNPTFQFVYANNTL